MRLGTAQHCNLTKYTSVMFQVRDHLSNVIRHGVPQNVLRFGIAQQCIKIEIYLALQ